MLINLKKIFYYFFYAAKVFWYSKKIWPTLFWLSFWATNSEYKKITARNFSFFVRGGNLFDKLIDMYAVLENVLFSPYMEQGIFIPKDATIIDIGGHIGSFSVYVASLAPEGKIYSYEPFLQSFSLASKNIEANGITNAKVFNLAVAEHEGSKFLYLNPKNNSGHSFTDKSGQSVEIKTTTPKKIFEENKIESCDLLKLDCEGGEYDILLNSGDEVFGKIKQISMEYHLPQFFGAGDSNLFEKLVLRLQSAGFEVLIKKENYQRGYLYAKKSNRSSNFEVKQL